MGLGVAQSGLLSGLAYTAWASSVKVSGDAPGCSWGSILTIYPDTKAFSDLVFESKQQTKSIRRDEEYGLELVENRGDHFWLRSESANEGANVLLGYLVAEHDWIASHRPDKAVQPGDIVIDVGAHVGVFTRKALDQGAEKVISIDPDPYQIECLRRNFSEEIAQGRVVLIPKGAWSSEGTMMLHIGTGNSGMSSFLTDRGGESVEVPLTTIDQVVAELGLPRVDYMKLDIEGAEREALRGAMQTLTKNRPQLMIDSYHREDDMEVLPAILAEAYAEYGATRGNCEPSWDRPGTLAPHFVFFD